MAATLPVWKANGVAVSNTTGITVLAPTGHASGDFLLLAVNTSAEDIPVAPTGWTYIGADFIGSAATADSAGLFLYYRFATGTGESAVIGDSGNHTLGVITSFTGVSTDTPIETLSGFTFKGTNSTSDTFPAITTVGSNRLVVAAISTGQESVKSAATFSGLGSFTARGVGVTTAGLDGGVALFSGTKVAAGSTGTGTVTASISSKAVSCTFALRPVDFEQAVSPTGIASSQAFGSPNIVGGAVSITTGATLSQALVGATNANVQLYAKGGSGTYTWTLVSGTLPSGQSLSSGGLLSGSPTTAGNYSFTLRATEVGGSSSFGDKAFTRSVIVLNSANYFDVVTWTGNGSSSAQTYNTTVDLSGGGYVAIYKRTGAGAGDEHFTSPDGTNVYRNSALSSGSSFANGSFTLTTPMNFNQSGGTYYALVFKKDPTFCDVVVLTGNGSTDRTVAHSLSSTPVFLGKNGFGGVEWLTGFAVDQRAVLGDFPLYKAGGGQGFQYWGTVTPTATEFHIGGNTSSTNANNINECYVLFPSGSAMLAIGEYVGTGSTNSAAIVPGWDVLAILTNGGQSVGWAIADIVRTPGFTGNDETTTSSLAADSSLDRFAAQTGGITLQGANSNVNGTTYGYLAIRYAPGSSNFTISPTGIASAQAFGTLVVTTGAVSVSPTALASAEAFGSPTILQPQTVVATGIASAEALGSPTVLAGAVTVLPTGIASAQAIGSPTVLPGAVSILPAAIATGEAFGSPTVVAGAVTVAPTAISSSEAFGSPTLLPGAVIVSPTAIDSGEAFGTPVVMATGGTQTLAPPGITSAESFGSPTLVAGSVTITTTGISSVEAFGSPSVLHGAVTVAPAGIASAEAFGSPTLLRGAVTVSPAGIASTEAFGTPTVVAGAATIAPTGIASAQAFGIPSLLAGSVSIAPAGIGSAEAFGSPTALPGAVSVSPAGMASAEAFGAPTLTQQQFLAPASIGSGEAFGVPTLQPGGVALALAGIGSAESFGVPSVIGTTLVQVVGIASSEAFGVPLADSVAYIGTNGIASGELFGSPTVVGATVVAVASIPSEEAFGQPTIAQQQFLAPDGIESGEGFGTPTLQPGVATAPVDGIASEEAFGEPFISSSYTIDLAGIDSGEAHGIVTLIPGEVWIAVVGIGSEEAFGIVYAGGGSRLPAPIGAKRDRSLASGQRENLLTQAERDNTTNDAERDGSSNVGIRPRTQPVGSRET